MKLITAFDPSQFLQGDNIHTGGINANEQLMLYNDSIYALQLTFQDGSIDVIPALWNKDFIIKNMPMGDVKFSIYNQLSISNNPLSQVYGTLYEPSEHVASVNASMQRSVVSSIPGGVVSVGNSLVNTTNAASASAIVELANSTSSGDVTTLDNQGHLKNGNTAFPGTVSFDNGKITSDGNGNLVVAGTINGVYLDNNAGAHLARIGSSVANAGDILDATTGSLFIKAPSGNFSFQIPSGTGAWSRTGEGVISGSGSGTHGTGVGTPSAYGIDPCTVSGSSQTIGFTVAATTTITTGNGLAWLAICIKT